MTHLDKTLGAFSLAVISLMAAILPSIAQPTLPPPSKTVTNYCPDKKQPSSGGAQSESIKTEFSPSDVRIDKSKNGKLTLRQALDLANQNNKEIEAICLSIKRSTARIRAAEASSWPILGIEGSLDNNRRSLFFDQPNNQEFRSDGLGWQGRLNLEYGLNNLLGNSLEKAGLKQLESDKLDVEKAARKVRADVIKAYYDLQDADEQLKINQAAVTNAKESLRNAQIQEKAGLGTKFDVIRADVQKATAEQDVVKIESQQQAAQKTIAQLLNISENIEYSAAEPIAMKEQWTLDLDKSVSEALNNRPELKQQKIKRDASSLNAIAANAENDPQVSLFANYSAGQNFTANTGIGDNYGIGARVRLNLLDGGAVNSKIDQERVGASIAETESIAIRDKVRLEVETSFLSLSSNKKNITTAKGAQAQAQESLRLARLRLAAGVGTQLDVINAETELTRAKSNYSRAIVNYNRDLATLRNAVYANQ